MRIQENFSLKHLNSFRVDARARYFAEIESVNKLQKLLTDPSPTKLPKFVLGDGTNTLFTQDFDGLVIKIAIPGRRIVDETDETVTVEVGAGENWHATVTWIVDHNWGGVENLALIPGTVGAAPVQNIAAYGQNLVDVFESLDAVDLQTGQTRTFTRVDCEFGYRSSIFKRELKDRFVIAQVRLKLRKHGPLTTDYHSMWVKYESIEQELAQTATPPYSIRDAYQAVINIRTRQLPDVTTTPTVGSFFVNPIVSHQQLTNLQQQIPELQSYPIDQLHYPKFDDPAVNQANYIKVPAGRLLDHLGWRGKKSTNDHVQVWDKHALIIVTNGQASGQEILEFSQKMQDDVRKNFGIELESEVNLA